jgi:hypothetical protein
MLQASCKQWLIGMSEKAEAKCMDGTLEMIRVLCGRGSIYEISVCFCTKAFFVFVDALY